MVDDAALDTACPRGMFVARRALDITLSRSEQLDVLRSGWPLSPWTRLLLHTRVADGPMPFVATICGFVALGADITDVTVEPDGATSLGLSAPGSWFGLVVRRRLPTGPGRSWVIRGWQPYAQDRRT